MFSTVRQLAVLAEVWAVALQYVYNLTQTNSVQDRLYWQHVRLWEAAAAGRCHATRAYLHAP
jgi:hypothetical protein